MITIDPRSQIFATRFESPLYVDLDGTRPIELARRAGISKQAVTQLVDELVAGGMLARRPDPNDGRAQLVTFTDAGLAQLLAGFDVLDGIERELQAAAGKARLERLRRDLAVLVRALGVQPAD